MADTPKERAKHVAAPATAKEADKGEGRRKLTNPNEKILWLSSAARTDSERIEMLFFALALREGDKLAEDLQQHFQRRWHAQAPDPDATPGAGNP